MCGIVGYLGSKNSVDVILTGLSRLEYRGYDSAGICLIDEAGELQNYKKTGKLTNLETHISELNLSSHIGIGHTRWATHGSVTDYNAHPHQNDKIALVHNGIIENADRLRDQLKSEGFEFKSETDSEVFLNLVTKNYLVSNDLLNAVRTAFREIEGNSAFVVIDKEANQIVTVKRTAPLVCGKNFHTQELFVSSDPYALVGYVDTLYFPKDEVFTHLRLQDDQVWIDFVDIDGERTTNVDQKIQGMTVDSTDKGTYEHYMLKEIHEQPLLIRNWINYYYNEEGLGLLDRLKELNFDAINISACGTAYHAGLCIRDYVEKNLKVHANVEVASEFRYREPLLSDKEIGLFISQSGETADTLAAEELCREGGMQTFSIVNTEGSTLYRNCVENLLIRAGVEIGVASTKAFTLQALTGYLFVKALEGKMQDESIQSEFNILADRLEAMLGNTESIQAIAKEIYNLKGYLFTGRGKYFPIALEGALKLKEIAYVHAEGYASGELKHGPIALIDEQMVNIAIVGPELYDKTVSNMEEIKARRGIIVGIGPIGDRNLASKCEHYIPVDFEGLPNLSPLLVNVVCQLLSYYMAKFKGTDIDKPRNLAKSVTVE